MYKTRSRILIKIFTAALTGLCFCSSCQPQLRPDVAMEVLDNKKELEYFTEFCDTDVTISVDEESINPGYGYTGDSFEYDGEKYILIPPTARYMDEHRKSAVANLDDGDDMMTVYEYAYPEELHVLNVSKALYCRESDLEDLYRLYNSDIGFGYEFIFMVPNRSGQMVIEDIRKTLFDTDVFLGLANASSEYCEETEHVERNTKIVRIRQTTDDSYFLRSLEFYRVDGEYYMYIFNKMSEDGTPMDNHTLYKITDDYVINYLEERMDKCNTILEEEYGHEAEY
jgi:hypothetical protein